MLAIGICAGLSLAFAMIAASFPQTPIEYDNKLSGVSWLVLLGMLALIFIGLGWCFLRAIRAAGAAAPEQQAEA